jgi:GTP-binding protein
MALNKIDLPEATAQLPRLESFCSDLGRPTFRISAATGQGVGALLRETANLLATLPLPEQKEVQVLEPVRQPVVSREDGIFVVQHPPSERLAAQWNVGKEEALPILRRQLQRLGLDRALRRAGVRAGDRVRIGELEMEWAD